MNISNENELIEVEIDKSINYTPITEKQRKDIEYRIEHSCQYQRIINSKFNEPLEIDKDYEKYIRNCIVKAVKFPNTKILINQRYIYKNFKSINKSIRPIQEIIKEYNIVNLELKNRGNSYFYLIYKT